MSDADKNEPLPYKSILYRLTACAEVLGWRDISSATIVNVREDLLHIIVSLKHLRDE